MTEEIHKQVQFAKSHSNVADAKGACAFKGKKLLISGWSRLPLQYHYTSEKSSQFPELHLSAVQDLVIKLGSFRRVSYSDLEVAVSEKPTLNDLSLLVDMGFKKLWIPGESKSLDPVEYFRNALKDRRITF